MKTLLRSKKGQGTTEYIAILAIAVLFLVFFWDRVKPLLQGKVSDIASGIQKAR